MNGSVSILHVFVIVPIFLAHATIVSTVHYLETGSAMQASFTACVGGGIPSPLEVNSIFYRGLCSSCYHCNTFMIVWVLIFSFVHVVCDTEHTINVCIVQYNIPPGKSFFRPSLETVSN